MKAWPIKNLEGLSEGLAFSQFDYFNDKALMSEQFGIAY
jgi:hypothetical protein